MAQAPLLYLKDLMQGATPMVNGEQGVHHLPETRFQLFPTVAVNSMFHGYVECFLKAAYKPQHDGILVRKILIQGTDTHTGFPGDGIRIESRQPLGFQNASRSFENAGHRFQRPRLNGHFPCRCTAFTGPSATVPNASFFREHLLT